MSFTLVTPENNKANVERLSDIQEKKDLEKQQKVIEGLFHFFMFDVEDMEQMPKSPMNNKRRTKKSK